MAVACVASCGGNGNGSGFGGGSSGGGASSGASGGGTGDDGSVCFTNCGPQNGDASFNGGSSSGTQPPPHMDAGVSSTTCTDPMVPAATVAKLEAGGAVDSAMKWLYPYDGTVFPGGILPPVLQWAPQSGGADAVYLHMKSQLFEYKGCFPKRHRDAAADPRRPGGTRRSARATAAPTADRRADDDRGRQGERPDPGELDDRAREPQGPHLLQHVQLHDRVAAAGSQRRGHEAQAGQRQPTALLSIAGTVPVGPCISCHSLSADGSMLVAQKHAYPGGPHGAGQHELQPEERGAERDEPDAPRVDHGGRLGIQRRLSGRVAAA